MTEKPTLHVLLTKDGVEIISDNRPKPESLLHEIRSLKTSLESNIPDDERLAKQAKLDSLTSQFDLFLGETQRQATNRVLKNKGMEPLDESSLPY